MKRLAHLALTGFIAHSLLVSSMAQSVATPCGGAEQDLWAWGWAGNQGEFVTTRSGDFGKLVITEMQDLSGNGNHFSNTNGGVQTQPGYQEGVSSVGYSTDLPAVALSSYSDGTNIYLQFLEQDATMNADAFYLAFAGMNTRSAGHRWLWGTQSSNGVRLDQTDDRVDIIINGNGQNLTAKGALPRGPILLEIWRDGSGRLTTFINGTDASLADTTDNSAFALSGVGGGLQSGDSAWDDYAFEYIACDGLPTSTDRQQVREYLRSKWGLFGEVSAPAPAPNPPSSLLVE